MRNLISVNDLTNDDMGAIVQWAMKLSTTRSARTPLAGKTVGINFRKTSTRTRTAFTVGALRLGAQVVTYQPGDLQLNTGETVEDTARVLGGMLDLLVLRTAEGPDELRTMARCGGISVVNAMTSDEHPTQALSDLSTMALQFGKVEGLRILYLGEGNNTAAALALSLTRYPGVELHLRTPPGYGLSEEVFRTALSRSRAHGSVITEAHTADDLPQGVDVVYTTRWQTTGTSKADPDWREVFRPFQVSADTFRTSENAVFMHDLPAHRGQEVTAEVLDGPRSIAFRQAEQKLYGAMAVLEWCMGGSLTW